MSTSTSEKTRVGVLVDPVHARSIDDASWRIEDAVVETSDDVETALERLLDHQPSVVVIGGDDAFIGRVLSTYEFGHDLKTNALRIHPASVAGSAQLAAGLGASELSPKLIRQCVKAVRSGRTKRRQVDTLKVVVSSEPGAMLGFSFGAGIFYRLFEAYKRARTETSAKVAGTLFGLAKQMILEGGRTFEPVTGKLSVDGEPVAEQVGYLVCSSLDKTWLGLSMDTGTDRAGLRLGRQGRELAKRIASSRALPGFVRSDTARDFERLDVDWSSGFVLDGELVEPGVSHALRVESGPAVECVTL